MRNLLPIFVLLLADCKSKPETDHSQDQANQVESSVNKCEGYQVREFQMTEEVVCHSGILISDSPESFIQLNSFYGIDQKVERVFFQVEPINVADSNSFEIVGDFYGRDRANVFYRDKVLNKASPRTFEFISGHFSKDQDHVYWGSKIVELADASTFLEIKPISQSNINFLYSYRFYQDANRIYDTNANSLSEKWNLNIDLQTFIHYGGPFIRINGKLYLFEKEDTELNPETFQYLGCYVAPVDDPIDFFKEENLDNSGLTFSLPPLKYDYCYGINNGIVIEREVVAPVQ